jgi:MinD-like ATPase involved in chromosome partitioning or flagellar assembly
MIYLFCSGRGGVGKTTMVANVGYLLGKLGKRVLLIDCDLMMASLNYHFGIVGVGVTINDYLMEEANPEEILYEVAPNVDAIFASETVGVLFELKDNFALRMKRLLDYFAPKYDFILVDSPKGIDRTTYSLLSIIDKSIFITTQDPESIGSLLKMKQIAIKVGNEPTGYILNKYIKESFAYSEEEITNVLALKCWGKVRYIEELKYTKTKDLRKRKPFVMTYPNHIATQEFENIARRIAGIPVKEIRERKSIIDIILGLLGFR